MDYLETELKREENGEMKLFKQERVKIQTEYEKASLELNEEGLKLFRQTVDMMEEKSNNMMLKEENKIMEQITGKTSDYVGRFDCDAYTCNCSWFKYFKLCRHK